MQVVDGKARTASCENSSRHDNSSPPELPVTVENRSSGSIQTDQLKDLG
jgi:hypothetical protein